MLCCGSFVVCSNGCNRFIVSFVYFLLHFEFTFCVLEIPRLARSHTNRRHMRIRLYVRRIRNYIFFQFFCGIGIGFSSRLSLSLSTFFIQIYIKFVTQFIVNNQYDGQCDWQKTHRPANRQPNATEANVTLFPRNVRDHRTIALDERMWWKKSQMSRNHNDPISFYYTRSKFV